MFKIVFYVFCFCFLVCFYLFLLAQVPSVKQEPNTKTSNPVKSHASFLQVFYKFYFPKKLSLVFLKISENHSSFFFLRFLSQIPGFLKVNELNSNSKSTKTNLHIFWVSNGTNTNPSQSRYSCKQTTINHK